MNWNKHGLPEPRWFLISVVVFTVLFFLAVIVPFMVLDHVNRTKAVIHHTASPDVSAKTIDGWHKANGWDGIGYHFVIRANGDIEKGRSIKKIGAHAKGRNHYIGIALTGYNEFTEEQIKSLLELLGRLRISHIERHHKKCPGYGDYKLNAIFDKYPYLDDSRR